VESLTSAQNLTPDEMLSSDIHPWADDDSALMYSIRSQESVAKYLKTKYNQKTLLTQNAQKFYHR